MSSAMMSSRTNSADILGIGAQKAATSWAAAMLNLHPDVWFPEADALEGKEVRFFDTANWQHGVEWYQRIMTPPRPDLLATDVSPGYSRIGGDRIRACHRLSPAARVFFIVRNPIERDWSSLLMQAARLQFDVTAASFVDLMVFYDHRRISQFTTYEQTINRWRRFYGEQLWVGVYDDLLAAPEEFFKALCDHVGLAVDAIPDWRTRTRARVFEGPKVTIPEPMAEFLAKKYDPMVRRLGDLPGRDLTGWIAA